VRISAMKKSAYQKYKYLLARLKKLINDGRGETENAENLRKNMDKLWLKIPEDKRRKINQNVSLPKPMT